MSEVKVCRICLETDTKLYRYDRFQLLDFYEQIMKQKVSKRDSLPHYFCYECATLLHKYHKFKEKCHKGQKVLKNLLRKGSITLKRIAGIDREESNLKSPIAILKVSKKVKTFSSLNSIDTYSDDDDVKDYDDDDSDDDYVPEENTEKEIQIKYPTFLKYDEPEIFVDTLKRTDEKILHEHIDIKPQTEEEKPIVTDSDTEINAEPSTSIFVEEKKDLKMEFNTIEEIKDTDNMSKPETKTHNFKMPTKFLDPKHWKKVVLSEDEAMEQFKARAVDQKYLSWPFKCVDCLKGFSKEDILKRHRLIRHTESLPLECRFCRSRFKWNNFLRKHMRQHFTKYECLRCNIVCPLESTAIFHDDYHNGVVKKCIHCNLEFTHMTTYYSHLRTHRSEHLCTLCGVSFVSPAGLKRHRKMKHVEDETKPPEDGKEESKTATFCEKCNIRFETKQAYDVHLLHSAMHLDGLEDQTKDETSIRRRVSGVPGDDEFTKEEAERNKSLGFTGAPFKYAKKQGKKIGYSKKPMDCYQCGKHFESQSACMRHHLAEHPRTSFYPNLARHICELCGASLAPGSVPQHMNMHTRKKMYPCDTCGRAFYASHQLEETSADAYGRETVWLQSLRKEVHSEQRNATAL